MHYHILNYTHPLTQDAIDIIGGIIAGSSPEQAVEFTLGQTEIPCQIDLEGDVAAQLRALFLQGQQAQVEVLYDVQDTVIFILNPPSTRLAAGYITACLSLSRPGYLVPIPPALMWSKRNPTRGAPMFIPAGIIWPETEQEAA